MAWQDRNCGTDFPHRAECRDTSVTFIELPALNLKAHLGNARQTVEKNGRSDQEEVVFCPIAHKPAYISYLYHMAFIEERSTKLFTGK